MNRTTRIASAAASVLLAAGALAACSAQAATSDDRITDAEVTELFEQWNDSLATGDAETVADHYAPGAVLLPTVSAIARTDRGMIVDYFTNDFLPKKPQGVITQSFVSVLDEDTATHSGTYDFTLTNTDGSTSVVPARFTFVYEKIDGDWLIEEHHSSVKPG